MNNAYHLLLLEYCLEVIASWTLPIPKWYTKSILQKAELQIIRLQLLRGKIHPEIAAQEISEGQEKLAWLMADKHALNIPKVFLFCIKVLLSEYSL